MASKQILLILIPVLITKKICGQILPLGGGCGCQQMPLAQTLQNFQVANGCGCGCNRNIQLANLQNGIQYANNLQLAKSLQPCGCLPNNLQLPNFNNLQFGNLQNLQMANLGNALQLANNLQMANMPMTQNDLIALINNVPNCQNVVQLGMQALLNQLTSMPVNCQCGCQSNLAPMGNLMNANNLNMLDINGFRSPANNMQIGGPNQPCAKMQMINGANSPPCANAQEIITNPCPCQSCQNPVSFTIY